MTTLETRFPDEQSRQHYIDVTASHADYCREAEPETLIYSGGLELRDNDRGPEIKSGDLLFVAVFANEAAAEKHRVDTRHQDVQKELESITRERILMNSYATTGCGFLWAEK